MATYKKFLRDSQEELKTDLIEQLLKLGCTKMDDGRQLYELNLSELIGVYEGVKNLWRKRSAAEKCY